MLFRSYFVAEARPAESPTITVGCGGWSKRKTLYGGDHWTGREDALLDPRQDAAKIRAFFIDPAWARRGVGSLILEACENAARAAGFKRFEMGATLAGVRLFRARGYVALENLSVPLPNGEFLSVVRRFKQASREIGPGLGPSSTHYISGKLRCFAGVATMHTLR